MTQGRTALDGARRRRIYLFRHADVRYVDEDGYAVPDSRAVPLTDRGREQARRMAELLTAVQFDRAVCSGLPRTRETAEILLAGRGLAVEDCPELEEIRPGRAVLDARFDLLRDVAYAGLRANDPDASLLGGETYRAFRKRVVGALLDLLAEPGWHTLAAVCHGGTNAMLLTWALGASLETFGSIEQDACCLNVLDVDVDATSGAVLRRFIRALNVTAYDPVKADIELTAWETIARQLLGDTNG